MILQDSRLNAVEEEKDGSADMILMCSLFPFHFYSFNTHLGLGFLPKLKQTKYLINYLDQNVNKLRFLIDKNDQKLVSSRTF